MIFFFLTEYAYTRVWKPNHTKWKEYPSAYYTALSMTATRR